ncbi:class I SAM-dependent RNA methyltransferase [Plastoroseomonas hellenica]|uniref:class I SAM-dependent RNA methyltransferase n=1 Tax=Plastoroseomonas hellenica TaxID=2687306 RepID=UPI001BACC5E0|nr:class I SAM-dependent RNA methyltransferase [Plastoroseomonas hellenica]MBR0644748.1 class I SAM-dependent RNA methyltransferase [Plastoroseomonas hellenica]
MTPVELLIRRLGTAGDGIAETPEGPVYVARALPGERITARMIGRDRAEPEAILDPSPERTAPPCRHFGEGCGGCATQHWAKAPSIAWKEARLAEALTRAGFADPALLPAAVTPPGRRRRADLAVRRDGPAIRLGFHRRGEGAVLDLLECAVLDPALIALLPALREALRRLPALKREASAVLNLLDTGPDLLLRTDGVPDASARAALAEFARAHGMPRIAWAKGEGAPENAAQLGPVSLKVGGVAVAPPPGAFLQASPEGEAAIIAAVLAGLPEKLPAKARIADLYAGIGTLSFPLAGRGMVAAYEGAAAAVTALDGGARASGLRVKAARRDLARQPLLVPELSPFAAVVLDPPFAGAAAQMPLLARAKVPRVIYVSCNPAALSRDAAVLAAAGYRLVSARLVDQFLWSAQIEAVAVFAR